MLSRLKFAERLSVSPLSIAELVDRYARSTTLVVPRPVPRLAPDPDDDVVIGTALAAKASLIVTGDRTLLEVARYQHVQIVSVQDALEAIGLR